MAAAPLPLTAALRSFTAQRGERMPRKASAAAMSSNVQEQIAA
jgi:hypothetical protein